MKFVVKRFFQTKPSKRAPCKIPNYPPLASENSITLEDGSIFTKLNYNVLIPCESFNKAPLMKNRQGHYLDETQLKQLIEDYKKGGPQNSLTQLSKRYNVARGFVLNKVFDKEKKEKFLRNLDNNMLGLSIKQQKGVVFSRLIRNKRENSWTDN